MAQRIGHYDGMSKNDWKHLRCGLKMGGVRKMYRQNKKKCSCARNNGRRTNNAGTDKGEEKKLAGPLAKKELSAEGCSRAGIFNPRPAGRLRFSGEFCAAREGYFTKYNTL